MNLQNIIIDFIENKVTSLCEDKHYNVEVLENVLNIEQTFKDTYKVDFNKVVVQLSEDQHMCEPRILCQHEDKTDFVTILDIATNHSELFLELRNIRILIEEKITKQLITE
jgi:hypothetical protein